MGRVWSFCDVTMRARRGTRARRAARRRAPGAGDGGRRGGTAPRRVLVRPPRTELRTPLTQLAARDPRAGALGGSGSTPAPQVQRQGVEGAATRQLGRMSHPRQPAPRCLADSKPGRLEIERRGLDLAELVQETAECSFAEDLRRWASVARRRSRSGAGAGPLGRGAHRAGRDQPAHQRRHRVLGREADRGHGGGTGRHRASHCSRRTTGIGIPEDTQPRFFEPLPGRGRVGAGTTGDFGLGLYIVRTIVESSRAGGISVTSAIGRGARFTRRFATRVQPREAVRRS